MLREGKKHDDETEREREAEGVEREREVRVGGWGSAGFCIDLTCLGCRPVEPVNSGVPEVPIVAQISDNDLCLAMIVGDRYWQAR